MSEELFKNVVIEAARIVNASDDHRKARIRQELGELQLQIDDFKKTTIVLLDFFRDKKYRDSLFTLDSIDEIFRGDLFRQLNDIDDSRTIYDNRDRMDKKRIELILETLINTENLRQVAMGSVTYYGLNTPEAREERLALKNNDFDVDQ